MSPLASTAAAGSGRGDRNRAAKRTRNEDTTEEVVTPSTMTRRQRSALMKSQASKQKSITNMSNDEFRKNRRINPYVKSRDPRVNECFWTRFQERIFYEEYPTHKNKVVEQFSISVPFMQAHLYYFGEALEVCEQLGLLDFIEINEDYDVHLVGQFFATLYFHTEDDRKITWMTKDQVFTATWAKFATMFGLQDYGATPDHAFSSTMFRVPYPEKSMGAHKLYDLYIP